MALDGVMLLDVTLLDGKNLKYLKSQNNLFIYLFIKNICVFNTQLMQKAQQRCYKSVAAIWTK